MSAQLGALGCWFSCTGVRPVWCGRSPPALRVGAGQPFARLALLHEHPPSCQPLGFGARASCGGGSPQPLPVGTAPTEAGSTLSCLTLRPPVSCPQQQLAGGHTLASEPLPPPSAAGSCPSPHSEAALLCTVGTPWWDGGGPGDTGPWHLWSSLPSESRRAVHCPTFTPELSRSCARHARSCPFVGDCDRLLRVDGGCCAVCVHP